MSSNRSSGNYVLYFIASILHLMDRFLLQRYAIIGETEVFFEFKTDANILPSERSDLDPFKAGVGTVVGYVHEYVTDRRSKGRPAGVYLRNSKFPPDGFLVRMDGTNRLVHVPLEDAELTNKYGRAIKAFNNRLGERARVGDHNPPLVGLEYDIVRLDTDSPDTERTITQIAFTPAGTAVYYLSMTKDEVNAENLRRELKARKLDRAWCRIHGGGTLGKYTRDRIVFVREGEESHAEGIVFL